MNAQLPQILDCKYCLSLSFCQCTLSKEGAGSMARRRLWKQCLRSNHTCVHKHIHTVSLSLSNLLSPPNWSIAIGFHNISWRVIFLVEKCWPTWRSYWDAKASFFEGRAVWLLARTRAPTKPRSIGLCNNQWRDALWDPDTWRPHEECTSTSCQVSDKSKFHNHPPTNLRKNSWWLLYGNVGVFAPIAIISLQKLLLPWFNILISNKDVISEGWATSPSTHPSNLDHVSGGRTYYGLFNGINVRSVVVSKQVAC